MCLAQRLKSSDTPFSTPSNFSVNFLTDPSWVVHNGRQYKLLASLTTYATAASACGAEDPAATLVSIGDQTENDFVLQYTSLHSGSDVLWTDFTIATTGTVSRTSDSYTLEVSDFGYDTSGSVAPYESGAPSAFGAAGSCVLFVVRNGGADSGLWRDTDCGVSRRPMCERADYTTTVTTTTTVCFIDLGHSYGWSLCDILLAASAPQLTTWLPYFAYPSLSPLFLHRRRPQPLRLPPRPPLPRPPSRTPALRSSAATPSSTGEATSSSTWSA